MVPTTGAFGDSAAALRLLLLLLLKVERQSVVWQGRGHGRSLAFVGSGGSRHEVQGSFGVHGARLLVLRRAGGRVSEGMLRVGGCS